MSCMVPSTLRSFMLARPPAARGSAVTPRCTQVSIPADWTVLTSAGLRRSTPRCSTLAGNGSSGSSSSTATTCSTSGSSARAATSRRPVERAAPVTSTRRPIRPRPAPQAISTGSPDPAPNRPAARPWLTARASDPNESSCRTSSPAATEANVSATTTRWARPPARTSTASPTATPARSRSSRRRSRARLPKWSTATTLARARSPSTRAAGRSSRTSRAGSSSGPSSPGSTPAATWAAAGANTSRPWKVRDTVFNRYAGFSSATTRSDPAQCLGRPHQQPVVRPDQHLSPGLDRHHPPPGPHLRVDHRQMHRPRQVRHRLGQHPGPLPHVLRPHRMAHVQHPRPRGHPGHDPVAHPHEVVLQPVVTGEGDPVVPSHARHCAPRRLMTPGGRGATRGRWGRRR